ncbi:MAG TPA: hypothetical protein VFV66_02445 [Nonomuraea sp.]|nr:hypothetical protein [Nonomuraea sp.]
MRAAWLAAGTVATVIALLLSTVLLWRGFARARTPIDTVHRSIAFTSDKVEIRTSSGPVNLVVVPGRAGELLITRTLRWSQDRPVATEVWDAARSTLRLEADCRGADQPDGPVCQADYLVSVPPETHLVAATTRGKLTVSEAFGSVRVTSVSGNVRLDDVAGPVWARSGTGSVTGGRLAGGLADVETGSGNVDLSFAGAPASVRAVVRTAGDVNVYVPPAAYDVTVSAPNATVAVKRDKTSPRKITARVKAGWVSLCCR